MTRAEAKAVLVASGVTEPTEEQISNLLDSVTAETRKEKERADRLKEKADKADELQGQLDDLQSQGLSDSEKANKALEDANKKIAELTSNTFKAEAKAILGKANLEDADIEALLPGMIAGIDKLEDVQARANAYVGTVNKVRENAIKEKEKTDLDNTNTPGGNGGGTGGNEDKSDAAKYAENLVKSNGTDSKDSESIIGNYK